MKGNWWSLTRGQTDRKDRERVGDVREKTRKRAKKNRSFWLLHRWNSLASDGEPRQAPSVGNFAITALTLSLSPSLESQWWTVDWRARQNSIRPFDPTTFLLVSRVAVRNGQSDDYWASSNCESCPAPLLQWNNFEGRHRPTSKYKYKIKIVNGSELYGPAAGWSLNGISAGVWISTRWLVWENLYPGCGALEVAIRWTSSDLSEYRNLPSCSVSPVIDHGKHSRGQIWGQIEDQIYQAVTLSLSLPPSFCVSLSLCHSWLINVTLSVQ